MHATKGTLDARLNVDVTTVFRKQRKTELGLFNWATLSVVADAPEGGKPTRTL